MARVSLHKPSLDCVRRFLATQQHLPLTYTAIGATAATPPPGYVIDHTRVHLGSGQASFQRAKAALADWRQFDLGWVQACPNDVPIASGQVVAVLGRAWGLWWTNACRIVYVVDEERQFGFANGTLPEHVECGEERFLIEWNPADDGVWYDILAFARPQHWLARLGYPWVRRLQKRFARDSVASLLRAE